MGAGLLAGCCGRATGRVRLWITVIHKLSTVNLCGQPVNKLWITSATSVAQKPHQKLSTAYPQPERRPASPSTPTMFERATIITHFGQSVKLAAKTLQAQCVLLAT